MSASGPSRHFAALRDTSVLFAAAIAVIVLKEPLQRPRIIAAVMIVTGLGHSLLRDARRVCTRGLSDHATLEPARPHGDEAIRAWPSTPASG